MTKQDIKNESASISYLFTIADSLHMDLQKVNKRLDKHLSEQAPLDYRTFLLWALFIFAAWTVAFLWVVL